MHGSLHETAHAPLNGSLPPDMPPHMPPAAMFPDAALPDTGAPGTLPNMGAPATPAPEVRVLRLADRDATLVRATGSGDARVQGWLINDVVGALDMPQGHGENPAAPNAEDRVCAAISAMCDIGPRDTLEGMLAAQMVAVHAAAMGCFRRAADASASERARDADLRHAARLLHLFERQLRARDDRRNPHLMRGLTGALAPDAPGRAPGARVRPAKAAEDDASPEAAETAADAAAPDAAPADASAPAAPAAAAHPSANGSAGNGHAGNRSPGSRSAGKCRASRRNAARRTR